MKRLTALLLLLFLFIACVPTPEVDAVKQKDTNVLIDTVRTENQQQMNAGTELPPISAQFPERFACDFTTSAQNVHVVADVPLEILTDSAFPTLRVERRVLTSKERMTIVRRLLDSENLYVFEEHITRKDLEKYIAIMMQEPSPEEKAEWMREEDGTEEEWQKVLESRKAHAAELQQKYNELPSDDSRAPLIPWDGTVPEFDPEGVNAYDIVSDPMPEGYRAQQTRASVGANELDSGIGYQIGDRGDYDSTSIYGFDHSRKFGTERINPGDYDKPHDGATVTPNEAVKLVQGLFDGVADLVPADIYWANNTATDGDITGANEYTRWAYLIHLSHSYNGAYSPYCSSYAGDFDSSAAFIRVWNYESVIAAVDGDGNLISLVWQAPLKVTQTIAESTPLLPYEEIQKVFETQINRKFGHEGAINAALTVKSVQLGLFRIREQNDLDHGLLVPVWFFTGYIENDDVFQGGSQYDSLNPLLIINAIDGSIIDPVKGY